MRIQAEIIKSVEEGYDALLCGMAMGFDLVCGSNVFCLKQNHAPTGALLCRSCYLRFAISVYRRLAIIGRRLGRAGAESPPTFMSVPSSDWLLFRHIMAIASMDLGALSTAWLWAISFSRPINKTVTFTTFVIVAAVLASAANQFV